MADSDDEFGIYIHHGGKFTTVGCARMYLGGKADLSMQDRDRFGFFDLEELVREFGYARWDCLAWKAPRTLAFFDIHNDADVMKMLNISLCKNKFCSVYVDKGELGSDKTVEQGSEKPLQLGKEKPLEMGKENAGEVEKGKTVGKGKEKLSRPEKKKVNKPVGTSPITRSKKVIDEGQGTVSVRTSPITRSRKVLGLGENSLPVETTPKKKGKEKQVTRTLVDEPIIETDPEDSDYILPEDGEQYEIDDSLGDNELGSDDEEYRDARLNLRLVEGVVQEREEGDLPDDVSMSEGGSADPRGSNTEGDGGMLSDYIVSDGDVVSDSTDEEEGPKRLPRIMYDPRCNHKDLIVQIGLRFENGYQCKEALRSWAILKGYPIRFRRVSKKQLDTKCRPPCIWRCYGSDIKDQCTFAVKVLVGEHTCLFDIHNKLADYKWLAKQYIEVFRLRPCMQVQEMALDVNTRFSIQPSLGRLYRAKAHALELLRGSVKKHYNSLRSYMSELMRVDKEGRFELLLGDDSVFRGLYIGFSALRKGFMEGCRRIIGLDGCFLKTYLGGQLLCAVSKDGNNQMFPVAWAVVEAENEECWSWFIKILLEDLGVTDGLGISFISDQQKGLQNAVASLAPFAEHRNCARHVYCNWKKTHK
ncbi:uncharacterized protein LOC130989987 [Salvia miltiorrhiza]|uniref:uncharacterized protein LOC130989987 n=1 Tax=Salvia miltiorrhiza TaxID=226208 RepID=UPI0025ACA031|nr:uncharacterized protein LOC130989987 [Salvia miltiorrhiza]